MISNVMDKRFMKRRFTAAVGVVVAVTLAASACSSGGSPEPTDDAAATKGGTLTILTSYTDINLDPALGWNSPVEVNGLVTRTLTTWKVEPGEEVEVVPDLATDTGTPNDDGTVWTYTLRDDVTFEDGTPISSADIKYGLERSFAAELTGGISYHKQLLVGGADYEGPYDGEELASIETPDDKTIVFHLNTPYGAWPWVTGTPAFAPVPEAKDNPATYKYSPVASGPYRVESNEDGKATVLVRNENWDPETDDVRPALPDKIVYKQNQNVATTTQTLISDIGEAKTSVSHEPLGAAELALVNANPAAKERLVTSGPATYTYLAMNTERGPLQDIKLRQALEYGIDRKAVITSQGGSQVAEPATTITLPGMPGHGEFDLFPAGESGDVEKAKELLAESSYDGTPLDLWTANTPRWQAAAQAVQQGWERIGVEVNIRPLDERAMYSEAHSDNTTYDLFLTWWSPDFPSPLGFLQLMFHSTELAGGYNFSRYSTPEIDAGLAEAAAEVDPEVAAELWASLEEQIMEGAPFVPLFFSKSSYLRGSNVVDYNVGEYPAYPNYLKIGVSE